MKTLMKLSIILFVFIISENTLFSQTATKQRKCGTVEVNDSIFNANPERLNSYQKTQAYINQYVKEHQGQLSKSTIYIQVVFHIVLSPAQMASFPDSRVYDQIDALNRDFSGQNPHTMGSFLNNLKTNTQIQFYLAYADENGNPTNGIERRDFFGGTQWGTDPGVKHFVSGGLDSWEPSRYLNIWICDLGNGLCAYALYPTTPLNNEFGLVSHYEYIGITGATPPYNNGSTSTHEIAHCFNLKHIWGDDGGCNVDDECADTPLQYDATYGDPMPPLYDACTTSGNGIMFMNFMDYVDDSTYANFTPNQAVRMQACFASGGPLEQLEQHTVYAGHDDNTCGQTFSFHAYPAYESGSSFYWTCLTSQVIFSNDTILNTVVTLPSYASSSITHTFVLTEINTLNSYSGSDTINIAFFEGCNEIKGTVFYDFNNNGVFDLGDNLANNIIVKIDNNYVSTDSSGNYNYIALSGNHNIYIPSLPSYIHETPLFQTASFTGSNSIDSLNNFALVVDPDTNLTVTCNISPARPGFPCNHYISVYNEGFFVLSANVRFVLDPQVQFNTAIPTPDVITGNILEWNNIPIFTNDYINLTVYTSIPVSLPIGTLLIDSAYVFPVINDIEPSNNVYIDYRNVSGSYDPNEKTVQPENGLTPTQLLAGDYLNYAIHFQNTGNDTAFTVVIKDTLSTMLDVGTLQIMGSSHPVTMQILDHNTVIWTFPNILLPDSSANEPLSNGYISYRIKPISTLAIGNQIQNTAYIYFDYNLPIVTNTTSSYILDPVIVSIQTISENNLMVYPNPFTDNCSIQFNLKETSPVLIEIYDIVGNKVVTLCNEIRAQGSHIINYSFQKTNSEQFYLIRMVTNEGQSVKKAVKL